MNCLKFVILLLGLGACFSVRAQDVLIDAPVYSTMDIYRAGGYDDGSDGIPPAVYAFPAKAGQVLIFSSVTGKWVCHVGDSPNGPDGSLAGGCYSPLGAIWINPIGPFSGYETANFAQAIVGVFLEESLPTAAPPPLTFVRGTPNGEGQIETNFRTLRSLIGQVFFIGTV